MEVVYTLRICAWSCGKLGKPALLLLPFGHAADEDPLLFRTWTLTGFIPRRAKVGIMQLRDSRTFDSFQSWTAALAVSQLKASGQRLVEKNTVGRACQNDEISPKCPNSWCFNLKCPNSWSLRSDMFPCRGLRVYEVTEFGAVTLKGNPQLTCECVQR